MKTFLAVTSSLLLLTNLPARAASPEIKAIAQALKTSSGEDLNVAILPKADARKLPSLQQNKSIERYAYQGARHMADAFIYTIYFQPQTGGYWVHRSGGYAGVNELYGPARLKP